MAIAKSHEQTIAAKTMDLAASDLESLRTAWRHRWGEPPRFRSRELLARAFAHRLQIDVFGDLPAPTQRRIAELGKQFLADRSFVPQAATTLLPGSSLIREWQGKRHEVAVVADGFLYQGEKFGSLSKVAHHITGTKWNGRAFFGLKRKGASA